MSIRGSRVVMYPSRLRTRLRRRDVQYTGQFFPSLRMSASYTYITELNLYFPCTCRARDLEDDLVMLQRKLSSMRTTFHDHMHTTGLDHHTGSDLRRWS